MALEMKEMLETMPQVGKVLWIRIRPARRAPMNILNSVQIHEDGLEGDRFAGKAGAPRTVTLIQKEHIDAVASILGREELAPSLLRRNIVVSGINLQALKNKNFKIGSVILFATGNCPPCSQMEENLGAGGYNAMRGHGGITARVVVPGEIHLNDEVSFQRET